MNQFIQCSPQASLRELAGHDGQLKVELYLPIDVVHAAKEQAEMYHWDDVNGLFIEAITHYLTHRDALPITKGQPLAHPDTSTSPEHQGANPNAQSHCPPLTRRACDSP